MMNATATASPVNALRQAEAGLIAAVNAAADALDTIGAGSLDAAMQRLKDAAEMAKRRLSEAKGVFSATVAGVTLDVEDFASELLADLDAPVALPQSATVADPVPATVAAPVNRIAAMMQPPANGHAAATVAGAPATVMIDLAEATTPAMPIATPTASPDATEAQEGTEADGKGNGDSEGKNKPSAKDARRTGGQGGQGGRRKR